MDVLTAELFDPGTGAFTDIAAPMAGGRHAHTATLLSNGTVLLAGGNPQTSPSPTAEAYDVASRTFAATTNHMLWQRAEHTATLLNDNRVLLVGGASVYGTLVPTAEIFNPVNGTFAPAGSLLVPRLRHQALLLPGGSVAVVGGRTSYVGLPMGLASVERWTTPPGDFTALGNLAVGRAIPSAAVLADGSILVIGGWSSGPLSHLTGERFTVPLTRCSSRTVHSLGRRTRRPLRHLSGVGRNRQLHIHCRERCTSDGSLACCRRRRSAERLR